MKALKHFSWTCLGLCLLFFLLGRIYNNWYNEQILKLTSLIFLLFWVLSVLVRRVLKEIREDLELEMLMKQYTDYTHAFERDGGYSYKSEIIGVLKGLGFLEEEFSKSVATLSGGQKTRVALGKLLLQKPDLIILDEPTNHLDMNSITWLETYLLNYKGAVIIVSHDRYFLDRIATKVIEIDQTKATTFMGN